MAIVAVRFVDERIDHEVQIARLLILKRADINPAAEHAAIRGATLVKLRDAIRPSHCIKVTLVNRRAAHKQRVRENVAAIWQYESAVIGQRAEQRIGYINLIARLVEAPAPPPVPITL